MKRLLPVFCLLLVANLFYTPSALSEDFVEREMDAGFLGAGWLSGDVNIDGGETVMTKQTSPMGRFFIDYYLQPGFAIGFYSQLSFYSAEMGHSTIIEGGFSLKPRVLLSQMLAVKPSIMVGFRRGVFRDPALNSVAVTGFGAQGAVEFQVAMGPTSILFVEGGFLNQLMGKNMVESVTWTAIPYAGLGIAF
ncbi:hypothetical protein GF324_12270 [bacterium]|nr:hypothetical protein [bacterium]